MSKSLHIICGRCDSDEDLSYRVRILGPDKAIVFVDCENCATLISLDEIIEERD